MKSYIEIPKPKFVKIIIKRNDDTNYFEDNSLPRNRKIVHFIQISTIINSIQIDFNRFIHDISNVKKKSYEVRIVQCLSFI